MSFNDLNLKSIYQPPADNPTVEFFVPALSQSVLYQRGTAYFSSEALYEMTVGVKGLVENGGKIQYIVSPYDLSHEDVNAIHEGYQQKAIDKMKDYILSPKTLFEEERLSLLSHLIEYGYMDIKIAFPKNVKKPGIYHHKLGILTDQIGNKIAFNGSYNETPNAMYSNNELFEISTTMNGDFEKVDTYSEIFESMWGNEYISAEVIDFPEDLKEAIKKYSQPIKWDIDEREFKSQTIRKMPEKPIALKMHDYQMRAVDNWIRNNYQGIFDMATGSGKTWTALYGVTELLHKKRTAVIICCPYQHLVDQWCEDLDSWGFDYIAGFSGSLTKNWKKKLHLKIEDYNRGVYKYICFITTNASFATPKIQKELDSIKGDKLLVVDEAHNFGTRRLLNTLNESYNYRLALSATIERYNDEEGTNSLFDFFGKKCISYTLEQAIKDHKLTRYFYYPIPVSLTEDELEEYEDLSYQISREVRIDKKTGKRIMSERGKKLLIDRARVVAGAKNKIKVLIELLKNEKDSNHMLIYCGATTVNDSDFNESQLNEGEIKQIDEVTNLLTNYLGIKATRFTSRESAEDRREIIKNFDKAQMCQALVAIKCLDEGVSVKSIEKAFILASSTNPREYVQRRGRVLRLYKGKEYAYIYDFITLPRDLDLIKDGSGSDSDLSLIKREIIRLKDFAMLAENQSESDKLLDRIEMKYGHININEESYCDD